jgi:large subunit ribosomal protein L33
MSTAGREEVTMARANELRPVVRLKSTAGTGYTYVTRKNRRNDPDRLIVRKYDREWDSTSSFAKSAEFPFQR